MNNWYIKIIKIKDQIVYKEKLQILKIHPKLLILKIHPKLLIMKNYKFYMKSVIMIKILIIIKKKMIKK
jgi:hypothetical protein